MQVVVFLQRRWTKQYQPHYKHMYPGVLVSGGTSEGIRIFPQPFVSCDSPWVWENRECLENNRSKNLTRKKSQLQIHSQFPTAETFWVIKRSHFRDFVLLPAVETYWATTPSLFTTGEAFSVQPCMQNQAFVQWAASAASEVVLSSEESCLELVPESFSWLYQWDKLSEVRSLSPERLTLFGSGVFHRAVEW